MPEKFPVTAPLLSVERAAVVVNAAARATDATKAKPLVPLPRRSRSAIAGAIVTKGRVRQSRRTPVGVAIPPPSPPVPPEPPLKPALTPGPPLPALLPLTVLFVSVSEPLRL